MTMAGILPANACPVSVMHMENPSKFWVSEPIGQEMTKEKQELIALEELLQKHCQRTSYNYQNNYFMPEIGDMVAVKHPETNRWHRAKIGDILHQAKGYIYKVFLVDLGKPVEAKSSSVRDLPAGWSNLDYQAFEVVLHGVFPTSKVMDYDIEKMKRKVIDHWPAAAVRFVKGLLKESDRAHLVYHKNIGKTIYGDLYLEMPNGPRSLIKELCDNEYALLDEENFEQVLADCNKEERKFFNMPSVLSPAPSDTCSNPSSKPSSARASNKPSRSIRDYLKEQNEHLKLRERNSNDRIHEWRKQCEEIRKHECDSDDDSCCHDVPIGRGQRRSRVAQGPNRRRTVQAESAPSDQFESVDSLAGEATSFVHPLLDLLDFKPEDPTSKTSSNPWEKKDTVSSIRLIPAGAFTGQINENAKNKRRGQQNGIVKKDWENSDQVFSGSDSISISSLPESQDCDSEKKAAHSLAYSENMKTNLNTYHQSSSSVEIKVNSPLIPRNEETISGGSRVNISHSSSIENKCDMSVRSVNTISTENSVNNNSSDVKRKPMSICQRMQERVKQSGNSSATKCDSSSSMIQNIMKMVSKSSVTNAQVPSSCVQRSEVVDIHQGADFNNTREQGAQQSMYKGSKTDKPLYTLSTDYVLRDRSAAARLLVHGYAGTRPIQSIAEASFPTEIHQALGRMNFKDPMRIQMYSWPAIMRGQYTVLVGPPKSGKTLSYIVPLVSFMLTPDVYSELRPGNGPLVLVLCSGSKSAQFVYEKCCLLLKLAGQTRVRVQIAYGSGRERELRDPLANGCDILISTPRCFLRLVQCSSLITNLDRLAHLVVDEVDILAEKFLPEVKDILTGCKLTLMQRSKVEVPIQLIAASEKWCPAVEQFAQHISQEFVVCISGYLEAAVYAKLSPQLHYLSNKNKIQKLLDILDGHEGLFKTVIVCQNSDEVEELMPFLKAQCLPVLMAHEHMTHNHNKEVYHQWKVSIPGSYPIIVCSDDVLCELNAQDAMILIHYSLPPTKTKFGFRFSVLMDNYPNLFQKTPKDEDKPECAVHIFMDKESKNLELPEVIQFMKRLSVPVSPELEAKSIEIINQKESQKSSAPLCDSLKAFGKCMEKVSCKSRHIVLNQVDKPVKIPESGEVKLKILHVHDASRYSARILEHTDLAGNSVPVPDDYFTISMAVYKHYSDEKNRLLHGIPKVGDMCGLESKINMFQRVQVVEIVKEDSKGVPEEAKVCFIDEGTCVIVKVYQLLALPEKLKQFQPQVVEVFLCNIMPCDIDTHWSQTASCRILNLIEKVNEEEQEGKFLTGKIALTIGNTLWVDPLKYCSYLTSVDTQVTELSFRKELLKCKLAVDNPSHLDNLRNMAHQAGLHVPSLEKTVTKKETPVRSLKMTELPKPQWAFLESEDFNTTVFVCANHPDEIFIRRLDLDDCFQKLVKNIKAYVETKPQGLNLKKGTLCLGKFPEDKIWYRAQVNEILEDNSVSLFFVDHGDYATVGIDDIYPITESLITKLPFQAIECSLAGIKPSDGDVWSEDATDILYDVVDEINILYAKVYGVTNQAKHTGGKKYEVLLVDTRTEKDVVINNLLIEKKLAVSDGRVLSYEKVNLRQTDDSDDESDIEQEVPVIKLSDLNTSQTVEEKTGTHNKKEIILPEREISEDSFSDTDNEGFDVVVDDVSGFISRMMGLESMQLPTMPRQSLPALPSTEPADSNEDSLPHTASKSNQSYSIDETVESDFIPPLASKTKTPEVLWYQDYFTITCKIRLTGVEQYYISWNETLLRFSTELNSQIYEVEGKFFGPVKPSTLTHSVTGFLVQIRVNKVVSGFLWPRLFYTEMKQPWLKIDLDMFKEDVSSYEQTVEERCKKAVWEANSSVKKPLIPTSSWEDEIAPEFMSSDEDDDDDEAGMEVYENPELNYDPYDPLN